MKEEALKVIEVTEERYDTNNLQRYSRKKVNMTSRQNLISKIISDLTIPLLLAEEKNKK